ncbi:ribosomal RNA-processing protein 8 [Bombus pyrosoma]|uniref:ribosomal RNA-processing protein 8 n=1 Tax=Bombus pyrosoma TaxID=396416 RepID=UPI001CB96D57|nr:ribosomal RNA-processing protein 8 [Bombus pyrosoma]XP_043584439.1 ribosomal RNA-processing protein 8 [Bombus pyrosoma]XP_043584440.1 ribosomal RNA-processing protein 8 [Bombus pyrosoma]XP_043584441.1 ribosomal RNA-processing protein 8 [Bombus pyrosoma]
MAKKLKKNATNAKNTGKNVSSKNNLQTRKQTEDDKNKHKSAIIKDHNLKFKNKSTKNKLTKTVKQIHKNGEKRAFTNILNSDTVKVVNVKNKDKGKISRQVQNKKNQQINDKKLKQQKQNKKNKISDQSKNKLSNDKELAKKAKSKSTGLEIKQKPKLNEKTKKLSKVLKKQIRQKESKFSTVSKKKNNDSQVIINRNLDIKRLETLLANKQKEQKKKEINMKPQSLRQRMMTKLKASRFRYLNETLYNNESSESKKYFKNDPDAFKAYHEGYKQQVDQWPVNPLDIVIASVKKVPKEYIVADFGCGEARLATEVPHKVHSFDFVSLNENVTACDVAHTNLLTSSVNVVVFCLSLMGTNLKDYIIEANRVLKKGGILKIAEVESRFEQVKDFIEAINSYGFKIIWKDLSHNLFYFLDFEKEKDIKGKRNNLPPITLKPCLYKKR